MTYSHPDPIDQRAAQEAREERFADIRYLPAAPAAVMPPTIFGKPLSGSAWVDLFSWYCNVECGPKAQAISIVLDEIALLEHRTGTQLGSEWTQSAIDAVWRCVRANTGARHG
jgi:hypothetical protein